MVKYGVLLALFALTFLLPGASKGWESVSMWWYLPMLAVALFLGVWIGKRRRDGSREGRKWKTVRATTRPAAAAARAGKSRAGEGPAPGKYGLSACPGGNEDPLCAAGPNVWERREKRRCFQP